MGPTNTGSYVYRLRNNNIEEIKDLLVKKFKIQDYEIEKNKIFIYDDVNLSDILKYLLDKDIVVTNTGVVEETIEDYYFSLSGGKKK